MERSLHNVSRRRFIKTGVKFTTAAILATAMDFVSSPRIRLDNPADIIGNLNHLNKDNPDYVFK